MKKIFDYMDARQFLKDYWEFLKTKNSKYSARYISREMGYKSPVYFTRIINHKSDARSKSDKRSLTVGSNIQKLTTIFKLKGNEATYFKYLCLYTDEKNVNTKEMFLDKLISLNNTAKKKLIKEEFQFHKEWYNNTIWAILDVIDFKGDYSEIASRIFPRVPLQKIKSSIALLKKLGFIEKNENGCWKPKEKAVYVKSEMYQEIVMQYWLKGLDLAKLAILGKPKSPPKIYTNTLSCSEKVHDKIIRRIEKLCSEITAMVSKDEPSERVLQFQFQLFDQYQP